MNCMDEYGCLLTGSLDATSRYSAKDSSGEGFLMGAEWQCLSRARQAIRVGIPPKVEAAGPKGSLWGEYDFLSVALTLARPVETADGAGLQFGLP